MSGTRLHDDVEDVSGPAVSAEPSPIRKVVGRALRQPMLVAGLALLLALILFSLVLPLTFDDTLAQVGAARPRQPPSANHLLGTDAQGRDVLASLVAATPQTLKIGILAGVMGLTALRRSRRRTISSSRASCCCSRSRSPWRCFCMDLIYPLIDPRITTER